MPTCLEAASYLVETVRRVRPQFVVTYDDFGQYGHPDTSRRTASPATRSMLALAPSFRAELGEACGRAKVYWTALPKSAVKHGIDLSLPPEARAFSGCSRRGSAMGAGRRNRHRENHRARPGADARWRRFGRT